MQMIKLLTRWLLVVMALALLALRFGLWRFRRMVDGEVAELFAASAIKDPVIVNEAMLAELPVPVQRYLRYSGVVGKSIPHTVRLQQQGRFRTDIDQPWMEIRADEYYTVDDPGGPACHPCSKFPYVLGLDKPRTRVIGCPK